VNGGSFNHAIWLRSLFTNQTSWLGSQSRTVPMEACRLQNDRHLAPTVASLAFGPIKSKDFDPGWHALRHEGRVSR